jgi:hypothetical protein
MTDDYRILRAELRRLLLALENEPAVREQYDNAESLLRALRQLDAVLGKEQVDHELAANIVKGIGRLASDNVFFERSPAGKMTADFMTKADKVFPV